MASRVRPTRKCTEVGRSKRSTLFRSSDDQNEVVIFFSTNDTAKAKDFVASPDLKSTMAKAGVVDRPTFYFLESAEPLPVMGSGWIELLGLHGE